MWKQNLCILSTELKMTYSRPKQRCSYCLFRLHCGLKHLIKITSDVLSGQTSEEVSSTLCPLCPLALLPLTQILPTLIFPPTLSSFVAYTKEQTWLLIINLWFQSVLISHMCLHMCILSSGDCLLSVGFQCLCLAINTNRVSVLNNVSNGGEVCLVFFKTVCVLFCKKCEPENMCLLVQIWADIFLLVCQV